jgi:hypothetical protein
MCLLLYIVDTGAISTETMDSSKTLVYGSQFTDNNMLQGMYFDYFFFRLMLVFG